MPRNQAGQTTRCGRRSRRPAAIDLVADRHRAAIVARPLRELRLVEADGRDRHIVARRLGNPQRLGDEPLLGDDIAAADAAVEALGRQRQCLRERELRAPGELAQLVGRAGRSVVGMVPEVAVGEVRQIRRDANGFAAARPRPARTPRPRQRTRSRRSAPAPRRSSRTRRRVVRRRAPAEAIGDRETPRLPWAITARFA